MARRSPTINHLFFIYASIVFCRATSNEWLEVQKVLEVYEKAVGQEINKHKSSVVFSTNTSKATRNSILKISGVLDCHNS